MAIKTVTCGLNTVKRAASAQGVSLAIDGWYQQGDFGHVDNGTPDVHAHTLADGTVAVRGSSLEGDLFLSLLVCGAL